MYRSLILPAGLLAGTIIGAGIFALPYTFEKAGILTGLFYLIVFGGALTLIHLMYADVILKTEEGRNFRRFSGYAKIYLGNWGFWLSILMTVVGMLFVLTIYLILSVDFINLIVPAGWAISDASNLLLFWVFGSAAIFRGIQRIAFSEFLITGGLIAIILIILGFGLGHLDKIISLPVFNFQNIFLPYGAILFALSGRVAIPALVSYFQKIGRPLTGVRKPIILGTLAPALVYLLFVLGISGLSGTISEDAISGLVGWLPREIITLIGFFGLISLWSSYMVIGLDVKNSLKLDLKFPKSLAGFTVIILPPLFYFLGLKNFLALVGMAGGVFIGLEGIFVVLMWLRSCQTTPRQIIRKKLHPFIGYALIMVFIGGIVYELIF